jgi:hypothetical protein
VLETDLVRMDQSPMIEKIVVSGMFLQDALTPRHAPCSAATIVAATIV